MGHGSLLPYFLQALTYHPGFHKGAVVGNIIRNGEWAVLVRTHIPQVCNIIESNNIADLTDEWVWSVAASGDYNLKDTYNSIWKRNDVVFLPDNLAEKKNL